MMWGKLWGTLATGRVGRHLYLSYAFAFLLFFGVFALPPSVRRSSGLHLPFAFGGYSSFVRKRA